MPKINCNDCTSEGWRAEVSWRPDGQDGDIPGHVQVATVNQHSPFEFPADGLESLRTEAEPFDGWRVTLDEAGIDRMIDALTKAKHAAFPRPQRWVDGDGVALDPALVRRFKADLTEAIKRGPTGITYLPSTDTPRDEPMSDIRVLDTNHTPDVCAGRACCFHNPSGHPLAAAPLNWREDDRMMVRVCEHNQEHPDIDYWRYALELLGRSEWHVCDGCCLAERVEA